MSGLGFNRPNQKHGERIDNLVSELKRLSLTCEFSGLRDSLIRDHIEGGVLSDELRSELLKKPDFTLQTAHDYCRTLEAAELQKYKSNTPTVAVTERSLHPLKKFKVHEKTTARYCKFCGYDHPFTQSPRYPALGKKCNKCNKEGHFAKVCKELSAKGSQLAAVEHEPPMDHDAHTYFGSVELDSVSGTPKKSRSLITVKIVQIKDQRYWCRGYSHPLYVVQGNHKQTSSENSATFEGLACT